VEELENDIPWAPWDEKNAPNIVFYEGPIEARDANGQVHVLMPLYSVLEPDSVLKNVMYSLTYAEIDRSDEEVNGYPILAQYFDGFFTDWRPIDHIPKKKSVYF
jgi:hypothetical protein